MKKIELKSLFIIFLLVFTVCFSLPFSALAESTLEIPNLIGFPGYNVLIPVNISNGEGVAGFQFNTYYDDNILSEQEIKKGSLILDDPEWQINSYLSTGAITTLGYQTQTEGLTQGHGNLLQMIFSINENAEIGTVSEINFTDFIISDTQGEPLPVTFSCGQISIVDGKKGDVNNDGVINVLDVVKTANMTLGKIIPTDLEKYAADVNDDGMINVTDVMQAVTTSLDQGGETPSEEFITNKDYIVSDWKFNLGKFQVSLEPWSGGDEAEQKLNPGWYEIAADCEFIGVDVIPFLTGAMVDVIYNDKSQEITSMEVTSQKISVGGNNLFYNFSLDEFEVNGVTYDGFYDFIAVNPEFYLPDEYYNVYLNDENEVWQVNPVSVSVPALVEQYDATNNGLYCKCSGSYHTSYNFTDEDVLVIKDGQYAELNDLQENDVVYIYENFPGLDYYLEAYSISDAGILEAYYAPEALIIDGVKYDIDENFSMSRDNGDDFEAMDLEGVYGTNIKYFLNKANKVVYLISDVDAFEME